MAQERTILHCDMNCFYASCEMAYHPELQGKPIAVCGDPERRSGIVLTASYPAKRYRSDSILSGKAYGRKDRHAALGGTAALSGYYLCTGTL